MDTYYIKYIWGPAGQEGYPDNNPENNIVTFAEGSKNQCERFRNCASFLLYETKSSRHNGLKGAMAIYAWGIVDQNQENLNINPEDKKGKRFSSGVRVILKKRVNPKNGISLRKIKELTGVRIIQRRGGLLSITQNQFEVLQKILETAEK